MNKRPTIEDARKEWCKLSIITTESPSSILVKLQDKYVSNLEETIAEAMTLLSHSRPIWNDTSCRWEEWHHKLLKLKNKTGL